MNSVAVLDIGKTNIKLSAVSRAGVILETVATANVPLAGPPYLHPDLAGIEDWFLSELAALAGRHGIAAIVACAHGSSAVLVDERGPVMPSIDYEEEVPHAIDAAYRAEIGPIEERGSPIMAGAQNLARQLYWVEAEWPQALARARWFLGAPQYWAWRLSGVAAAEVTYLGAQSHLWNVPERRPTRIVARKGWQRLVPPLQPAWKGLGRLKPDLARRHGLPESLEILCGIHDSSANFYRYQQAGLDNLSVISTGTWIVGLSAAFSPAAISHTSGMTWNADVYGNPITGMLAMGGREFAAIAGESPSRPADPRLLARLMHSGTMALPTFAFDDGPFPGSAGCGRVVGPQPGTPEERRALALLYVALVTDMCLDLMGSSATSVLDGSFVTEPLYAALLASLRPGGGLMFSTDAYGTAVGAALLADHEVRSGPAEMSLQIPAPLQLPGLDLYRRRWRELAAKPQPGLNAPREGHE